MTELAQEFLERFRSFKEFRVVGKSVQRVDAIEKALGRAKYTTDYLIENLLQVKVLRSMHPHAKILHVHTEDAKKLEGVNAVLTASDIPGVNDAGYVIPDQPLLAGDRVRYLGDGVALVAADLVEKATEALRLIRVDYEPLEGVFNPLDAMKPECTRIHEGGNVAASLKLRKGSVEAGFASADVTVEREYRTQFQEHAYLEPEAGIAIPEPDGSVTIIGSMQCPYNVQTTIAKVLNFPLERVRVIQATTGGGFGGKEDVSSEVCARAALVSYWTKKPSLLAHTREDSIIGHSKRHPYTMRYKYGAKKNGKLTAAQIRIISDTGAYASLGPLVLARSVIHATGPYDVPNVNVDAYCVYTNNTYAGAFRGFGNPQVHFAAESMMDELARELRMDPLEFRMKNILRLGSRTCTQPISLLSTSSIANFLFNSLLRLVNRFSRLKTQLDSPRSVLTLMDS